MTNIDFSAPPTCARFMKSESFGRLVAGPVGSGKTTACIFEILRRSCEQAPAPDGFRYTRWAIVRQTLKQLKDTVLKDIEAWLKGMVRYKVSDNTIYIEIGDVRSEWLLIPLDDPDDQRRLLSMQLTGAWLSEAIEMDISILSPLAGRCGRFPGPAQGGASWFGLIADTNFPSEASDWYDFMEHETPPDWQIFKQPSGMSDEAENLNWLTQTPDTLKLPLDHPDRIAQGRTYYERFVRSNTPEWCKRYVYAEYGDDPSGTAVFRTTFKSTFHVQDELTPIPGLPLIIGQDFGRDPWSIIMQPDHRGRLLILEEVEGADTGLEKHIAESLRPRLMDPRYLGKPIAIVGDPSGVSKGSIYEETSFDALKRLGFVAFPAPTNDIDPRLRAVEAWLMRQAEGGPAIIFDRQRCPTLIRAMGGGYRYAKMKSGQRKPSPDKNEYSHPSDALQYGCLAAHGGMVTSITSRLKRGIRRDRPKISAGAWT